ncbi:metalloregulator ArsR/SmtB family transcription factor (plasmid) [Deinococcus taeanensis]|uniref:ArsR/SmtB family transcription factor n=1 Tax=Deinococcus taeanensis TaxID=2737050 RepID=UPI001CDBD4F6|nr:metalloregulator ArsR/SmtB family transcription factor [Deinococcus taeanensis]UBV44168.1 metalloregulator ArsR/SmtB family transcription factor [Deinococcus taeanensis]
MKAATQDDVCDVNCLHPEAVDLARTHQPDHACIEQAAAFLKLMADPTRIRILSALQATELCVCDLAAVVGISESAVSHQLRLLRTGRIVTYRKEGRVAYYRLLDHHVTTTLGNALDHARE